MEKVVNAKEFAVMTGFPVASIRAYCRSGKLPCWRIGRLYLMLPSQAFDALKAIQKEETSGRASRRQTVDEVLYKARRKDVPVFDFRAALDALK